MIQQYITYLRNIRGYSENTCIAYEKDLRAFTAWIVENKTHARWSTITRHDIDLYVIARVNEGMKPATTNREIAAISGIYNYFIREGLLKENPCKWQSRRQIREAIPNTILIDELRTAYEHTEGWLKIMIGILASTGIRIQELLDMTWEDVDRSRDSIRICGKGNKDRIVYMLPGISEMLEKLSSPKYRHGKIFDIDQRSARHLLYTALKPYCHAKQLSPHAIRHTLATHMAAQGVNVTTIAQILGHNDIRTTQKYIDMTQLTTKHALLTNNIIN